MGHSNNTWHFSWLFRPLLLTFLCFCILWHTFAHFPVLLYTLVQSAVETLRWSQLINWWVRPCVMVRLLNFGIILQNYTEKVDNRKLNILVYHIFNSLLKVKSLLTVKNLKKFQYRQNVLKVSKIYWNVLIFVKNLKNNPQFLTFFRYAFKIFNKSQKFRYNFTKFYTWKVGIIFGRFLTVQNFWLSIIGNSRKSKISGKRMALLVRP